jgi:hypothetical protein
MEVFKVANEDKCYVEVRDSIRSWSSKTNISFEEYIENHPDYTSEDRKHWALQKMLLLELNYTNAPLEIAAPIKDFDTKGMELKDFKLSEIEIPDPVVLQPVFYARQKHYLIVTAWGQEASDELVVNQKMN